MSKCFIIMPITTPEGLIEEYQGDEDHFTHTLEHLFEPAITDAGLTPIPPIAKGADIILPRIIQEIESADMVFCDISTLNANVFFELGIRVALNKKICIVKDDKTKKMPFDTININCLTYDSSLEMWVIKDEIKKLSEHIKNSIEADEQHSLWRFFSLSAQAQFTSEETGLETKIDYLSMQVEALRNKLNEEPESRLHPDVAKRRLDEIFMALPPPERNVFHYKYGSGLVPPHSLEAAAKALNLSTEDFKKIEGRGFRRLEKLNISKVKIDKIWQISQGKSDFTFRGEYGL